MTRVIFFLFIAVILLLSYYASFYLSTDYYWYLGRVKALLSFRPIPNPLTVLFILPFYYLFGGLSPSILFFLLLLIISFTKKDITTLFLIIYLLFPPFRLNQLLATALYFSIPVLSERWKKVVALIIPFSQPITALLLYFVFPKNLAKVEKFLFLGIFLSLAYHALFLHSALEKRAGHSFYETSFPYFTLFYSPFLFALFLFAFLSPPWKSFFLHCVMLANFFFISALNFDLLGYISFGYLNVNQLLLAIYLGYLENKSTYKFASVLSVSMGGLTLIGTAVSCLKVIGL